MNENANQSVSLLSLNRVQALSDSVFAVAITLLILNIAVPVLSVINGSPATPELTAVLFALWPKVLVYGASFFLIGIFWFGHYLMFHYIEYADRALLWINNLLLMLVCFIPFSANVIGTYPMFVPSYILYGSTLFLTSLLYFILWKYVLRKKLLKKDLAPEFLAKANRVVSAAPFFYIVATLSALISLWLALALFIIVPLLYVIPGEIDDLFMR